MIYLIFFMLGFILFCFNPAWAEQKDEAKLEEIVVTATKTETLLDSAPGSVNLITQDDIKKRKVRTLDETMREIPGVSTYRTRIVLDTPTDSISLRGIPGSKRNLIMLDGLPITDPQGGNLKYSGLRFEDLERIEIVRGPFSALYGGNAMGGVVNFIPYLPSKREFNFSTSYGSGFERGKALDDYRKVYASYGDKLFDRLSVFISYGHEATNGFSNNLVQSIFTPPAGISGWEYTLSPTGSPRYTIGDYGDNKGWNNSFTFRLGYDFNKDTNLVFSIMRVWSTASYDEPHSYLKNVLGNTVWNAGAVPTAIREAQFLAGEISSDYYLYNASFKTRINDLKIKISFGMLDQDKYLFITPCVGSTTACGAAEFATRSGGPGKTHNTPAKNYLADIQLTFPLFERHILTIGTSFKEAQAETKEFKLSNWRNEDTKTKLTYESKGKDRVYAIYLQDEIIISDKIILYLGARYDWWKAFDGYENDLAEPEYPKIYDERTEKSISPKASLVYKIHDDIMLKMSAGKAFRPPTIRELYRKYLTPRSIVYGNPNLNSEKNTSWDIGIQSSLWKGSKFTITYFENYLKDLIYTKNTGVFIGTREKVEVINAGKAESKGFEISAEQKIADFLKIFTNLTWTDSKIKENPIKPETVGKRLTELPETMFNLGLELEKGPLSGSIIGRYKSKIYNNDENKDNVDNVFGSYDAFFVVDAKINYNLMKNASISLGVDNIFDKKYYYFYKQPRRSWFVELNCKF